MSSDTILKAPDGTRYSLDNLCSQKWLEGQVTGAEAVAAWLLNESVERFRQRKDDEAHELRNLADRINKELVPKLTKAASDHETKYPHEFAKGTRIR